MIEAPESPPYAAPKVRIRDVSVSASITAHVVCEHRSHTVTINPDGTPVFHDHEPVALGVLHALSGDPRPIFGCEATASVLLAAWVWRKRFLHQHTPDGVFDGPGQRWRNTAPLPCCRTGRAVSRGGPQEKPQPLETMAAGVSWQHVMSPQHAANEFGVDPIRLRQVTTAITAASLRAGETVPASERASMLAAGEVIRRNPFDIQAGAAIDNVWRIGISAAFFAAAARLWVAADPGPKSGARWATTARMFDEMTRRWWVHGVDAQWLDQVATSWEVAVAKGLLAAKSYGARWAAVVGSAFTQRMSPAEVESYLLVGICADLPDLYRHQVSAAQAMRFHDARQAAGRPADLVSWLEAGYTLELANECISANPTAATPVHDRVLAVLAHMKGYGSEVDHDRVLRVCTVVDTPARAARWVQTGATLPQMVDAVARKVPPGRL